MDLLQGNELACLSVSTFEDLRRTIASERNLQCRCESEKRWRTHRGICALSQLLQLLEGRRVVFAHLGNVNIDDLVDGLFCLELDKIAAGWEWDGSGSYQERAVGWKGVLLCRSMETGRQVD